MRQETIQIPALQRAARVMPDSIDADAREFDVVWTTGARVARFDFMRGEEFYEELEVSKKAVRLDRLNNGAPFLDSHRSFGLDGVLGTTVDGSAVVENGEGRARIRLAADDPDIDRVWNKIRQRIIRNISVGYHVHSYVERKENGKRILRAIDWEPLEISAVPIGADPAAGIRADDPAQTVACRIIHEGASMSDNSDQQSQPAPGWLARNMEQKFGAPGAAAPDAAVKAANDRATAIMNACAIAGVGMREAMEYVASGKPVDAIRADLNAKRAGQQGGGDTNPHHAPNPAGYERGWLAKRMAERYAGQGAAEPTATPGLLARKMAARYGAG